MHCRLTRPLMSAALVNSWKCFSLVSNICYKAFCGQNIYATVCPIWSVILIKLCYNVVKHFADNIKRFYPNMFKFAGIINLDGKSQFSALPVLWLHRLGLASCWRSWALSLAGDCFIFLFSLFHLCCIWDVNWLFHYCNLQVCCLASKFAAVFNTTCNLLVLHWRCSKQVLTLVYFAPFYTFVVKLSMSTHLTSNAG